MIGTRDDGEYVGGFSSDASIRSFLTTIAFMMTIYVGRWSNRVVGNDQVMKYEEAF